MAVLKKVLLGFFCLLFIAFIVFAFVIKSIYIDREENGLKYKTYVCVNEDGTESKIILTETGVTFVDIDFIQYYKTMATIKLAKENGISFNSLSQEEKDVAIQSEVDTMVYSNLLQRNKEYPYDYFKETGLIQLKGLLEGYQVSLSFSDTSFVKFIPTMKKPGLTLYNQLFE